MVLVVPGLPALAERTQSDFVLIPEGETVGEDLFAAGDVIVIAGVIDGDLVAAAFSEVRVDGEVRGDVTAIASRVIINGTVGGSVRVSAPDVTINGSVGDDVFTGAWEVEFGSEAEIGRDALVWARDLQVGGRIGRNLEGQFSRGVIAAEVAGDVDITVGDLQVTDSAAIVGDLVYVGDDAARISDQAQVDGSVIAERQLPPNVRVRAILLMVRVLASIAVVALGLAIIWAAPERSAAATSLLVSAPLRALAWGVGLFSIPVAMIIIVWLFVAFSPPATGLPLLLIFLPLVMAVFGVLMIGLLAAPVPVAAAIGQRIGPARSIYAWFTIGIVILLLTALIPIAGWLILFIAGLFGLGSWLLAEPSSDIQEQPGS